MANQSSEIRGSTADQTYDIGYGKPPAHTRFKPGQSGNPAGRPKSKKHDKCHIPAMNEELFKDTILDEAYRPITVREDGELVELPTIQVIMRQLTRKAMKGDFRSQRLLLEQVRETEKERKALHDLYLQTMIEYKTGWEIELDRRKALGITGPEPLPHPDDIVVDLDTGTIRLTGPRTEEEKGLWKQGKYERRTLEKLIADLKEREANNPDNDAYPKLLKKLDRRLDQMKAALGEQ